MLRRFFLLASFHCQSSASFCTTCSFRFLSLALVCRLLASRFLFFLSSYVSSPAGSIVIYISSCVLLNLVLCRPFDLLQLFAVRATIISVSQCSAVTSFGLVFGCLGSLAVCSAIRSVWPCVRLLEVFGRVFGCYKFLAVCSAVSSVWPCVRPFSSVWPCVRLLRVFGRVFGCYECLAVCSAVTIFGRVLSCYKRWPCVRPVSSIGRFRFCYFLHVFICTLFYLFRALLIHFFSRAFFFPRGTFHLFRHVLSRTRIFSRSFYSSIFYYCSALFMYSLFLHILCVLILLCFGRDFCFLLFRSYSRGLFCLGARLFCFVIVVVSAFCSMQCGLVSHHLSLIRISVFARSYLAFLHTIDMRTSLSSLCLVF